jgi:hypothetical protein
MPSPNESSTSSPRIFHVDKPWIVHVHQFPLGNVDWTNIHRQKWGSKMFDVLKPSEHNPNRKENKMENKVTAPLPGGFDDPRVQNFGVKEIKEHSAKLKAKILVAFMELSPEDQISHLRQMSPEERAKMQEWITNEERDDPNERITNGR